MQRPRIRRRLPLALAAAAALALAPSASAAETVMAKLAPFSEERAQGVAERTGLELDGTIPEIGWAAYVADDDVAAAEAALRADPAVWRIDPVAPGGGGGPDLTPSDTIFTQPGTVGAGQLTASWNWHWTITNFPAAWDIARGDGGTRVLVIDSEFDTEHLELKSKLLTGRNFDSGTPAYGTTSVRANDLDLTTLHGSHVAGLVAAVSDNANGVTGACFDCVVIPYKISLRGGPVGAPQASESKFVRDFAEALSDAAVRTDVRVISMSLGTDRLHQPMQDAVALALSRGKVLVASSGNGQLTNPGVPNYPASFPGVIGVGATQPDDNIAPFSTNGDFVDVSAPGHGILSTWDIRIPPDAAPPVTAPTHGVGFTNLSGTSMATPIVAGLAALMLQLRPDLSAPEVQGLLEASATDLGAPGKDNVFGAGRIDAVRALRAAQGFTRPAPPPPPPDGRPAARFFWSCTVGARSVAAGRRGFAPARRGQRLRCTGRTQPAVRRARLEIQRFAARRGWVRIGRVTTNNRGRFGFTRRLTTLGNWRVRVAYGGDARLRPSGSLAVKVAATPRRAR
ncbi:S8 family peptidase [Miltoncostaea marina]|uniref:S8 family peptidase n=1 Tax=Miltoncostaea marina TaxID=2843215 RepID=UPI001C3D95B2|nr:S8 family serine peptidase [Miltoncostaea marina]